MTCWTWRPCFRRTPGWGARSFSLENLTALNSPCPKSPGISMWTDTSPNLTEKRGRWWRGGLKENEGVSQHFPLEEWEQPWSDALLGKQSLYHFPRRPAGWNISQLANDRTGLQMRSDGDLYYLSEVEFNGYLQKYCDCLTDNAIIYTERSQASITFNLTNCSLLKV